jgi:hypothetical protein
VVTEREHERRTKRALVLALCLAACGGRSTSRHDVPVPASGGTGASGAQGGSGAVSSTAGSPGAGGTGGTGGTLGPAFTSTGPTTYVPSTYREPNDDEPYCHTTDLFSTLDDASIHQIYDFAGTASNSGPNWLFDAGLPGLGLAELSGEADSGFDVADLDSGIGIAAIGARLILPRFLPSSERPVCAIGPFFLERMRNYVALHFNAVGRLPSCAEGVPLAGSLDLCTGDTCSALAGTLGTTNIDEPFSVRSAGGSYIDGLTDSFIVRSVFSATSDTTATLEEAWIREPATQRVYCAGPESSADAEPEESAFGGLSYRRNVHLRGLRYVGSCTDATGSGTVTVRACQTR